MPVDGHVDVCASLPRDLDTICKLSISANVAVPQDGIRIFSLALQHLDAIAERNSAVAAKTDDLERVCIFEETAAASLSS